MNNLRIGDTIISARGQLFDVLSHDGMQARAQKRDAKRTRTFAVSRLECIDPDDGLWQEMES